MEGYSHKILWTAIVIKYIYVSKLHTSTMVTVKVSINASVTF